LQGTACGAILCPIEPTEAFDEENKNTEKEILLEFKDLLFHLDR
jgi:hypothetical protein